MRFLPLSVLLTATLFVPLRPAGAQAVTPISLRASTVQLTAAAALRPQAGVASDRSMLLRNDLYPHGSRREGGALGLVGVAGMITGLIIDEPAVTILSAGVGGLGLYFYLR